MINGCRRSNDPRFGRASSWGIRSNSPRYSEGSSGGYAVPEYARDSMSAKQRKESVAPVERNHAYCHQADLHLGVQSHPQCRRTVRRRPFTCLPAVSRPERPVHAGAVDSSRPSTVNGRIEKLPHEPCESSHDCSEPQVMLLQGVERLKLRCQRNVAHGQRQDHDDAARRHRQSNAESTTSSAARIRCDISRTDPCLRKLLRYVPLCRNFHSREVLV